MKIQLPLENWVEIFGWPCIERKNVGELMERINDRQFWSILMFCLHEIGEVSIGHLAICPSNVVDLENLERDYKRLEFSATPLPKNINNFKLLELWAYDFEYENPMQFARCLPFFRELIPLFADINLSIRLGITSKDLRAVLGGWAHQVEGVNWLIVKNMANFGAIKKFFPGLLKMSKALAFFAREFMLPEEFFKQFHQLWKWLTTKRERATANIDGGDEFKVLVITYCHFHSRTRIPRAMPWHLSCDAFVQMIFLQFAEATTPANFFIVVHQCDDFDLQYDQVENVTTEEELVMFRWRTEPELGAEKFGCVICRHPKTQQITFEWLLENYPDLFIWSHSQLRCNFPYPLELNKRMISM